MPIWKSDADTKSLPNETKIYAMVPEELAKPKEEDSSEPMGL